MKAMPTKHEIESWLKPVVERSMPKIQESGTFLAIYTGAGSYTKDPVALIQLGLAVILNKPIYVLCRKDETLPENFSRVARRIAYYEDSEEGLQMATSEILSDVYAKQQN